MRAKGTLMLGLFLPGLMLIGLPPVRTTGGRCPASVGTGPVPSRISMSALLTARTQDGYHDARVRVLPSQKCFRALMEMIQGAKQEILVCVYLVTQARKVKEVLEVLKKRKKNGVKVRVLTDDETRGGLKLLRQAGFQVRVWKKGRCDLHSKFIVVDGQYVIVGSHNWTGEALDGRNEEDSVQIDSEEVAKAFQERFEELWKKAKE